MIKKNISLDLLWGYTQSFGNTCILFWFYPTLISEGGWRPHSVACLLWSVLFVWFVFLHNCKFYFSFWIILMIGKVLGLLYWSKLQENWRGKGIGGVTVWATGEHSDVSGLILPVLYFAGLQDWPGAYFRVVPERQEVGVREARLWPPWWLLG